MTFPRLTFLARFTLVTLLAAAIASTILACTIETLHQQAVERDEIVDAVSQLDARLAAPLERLANGHVDAATDAGFREAQQNALLHQYVSDLRVFTPAGDAVYPHDDQPDRDALIAARTDRFTTRDHDDVRTVYQPFVTSNGRRFIIAVDFLTGSFAQQFESERVQVAIATIAVIALIASSLVALAAGASRELERRRKEAQGTFVQTLTTLADAIDLRDPYTAGHSKRVAAYSRQLALSLGLRDADVDTIENGALMHDIGKVGVPDAVLFKNGPLDAQERLLIRSHPVTGAGILAGMPSMCDIVPCILHHHERVDGSGYPDGLAGDRIPLGARIIAVADSFDAMTTDRPYRRGLAVDVAVEELLKHAGTQFDVHCVHAFADLVLRGDIVPPQRATGDVTFGQRAVVEPLRVVRR